MSEMTTETLTVTYIHGNPGKWCGNIMWPGRFPMRNGKLPANHPASPGARFAGDIGDSDRMKAFRERGYWASCFPEGDGITMSCERGQDAETVAKDIREVFGWTVKVKRP